MHLPLALEEHDGTGGLTGGDARGDDAVQTMETLGGEGSAHDRLLTPHSPGGAAGAAIRLAIAAISSAGSIGLGTWLVKPARSARVRSSARA